MITALGIIVTAYLVLGSWLGLLHLIESFYNNYEWQ